MLLLTELSHAEDVTVHVNILQHVCILVPTEPFVLPVKSERLIERQEDPKLLFRDVDCIKIGLVLVRKKIILLTNQILRGS